MKRISTYLSSFCLVVCVLVNGAGFSAPLPAKDIFQLKATLIDANTFWLEWKIKPGYFLYQERIKLTPHANSNFHLGNIELPPPLTHEAPNGKIDQVYREIMRLPVSVLGLEPGEGLLNVAYQGCSDSGFCYPPQMSQIRVTIDKQLALHDINMESISPTITNTSPTPDTFTQVFAEHDWPMIVLIFFGFGVLLSFTPCVLPMIPVLSGIIVGHGKALSTKRACMLTLTYVLGMSLMYAIVGAVVALMGSNLQILMQTHWAIGIFSLIFVLLALSMFDLYELRLPTRWQEKFANLSKLQKHGHYLNAFLMGCFSTLILSPCVTPPLIGALAYIAHNGSVVLGSFALFCLSLGMGTPLMLVGISAGKLLPKAGMWMNTIKSLFGILLLATAIYLLQRILSNLFTMFLWSILGIFSGVYLGALQKAENHHQRFRQSLGIILLAYGLLILIGVGQGHDNPLKPLASSISASISPLHKEAVTATSLQSVEEAVQTATAHGKPIILDFYAAWCTSCKHIEATTLQDAHVKNALQHVTIIKVDLTANDQNSQALLQHFDVVAPPTFVFLDTIGKEISPLRLVGQFNKLSLLKNISEMQQHHKYD